MNNVIDIINSLANERTPVAEYNIKDCRLHLLI